MTNLETYDRNKTLNMTDMETYDRYKTLSTTDHGKWLSQYLERDQSLDLKT